MPWVVTLKVTDCANGALLVGASMWDGSQTVFTDGNAQVIWYIDDYFTSYTVQVSKSGYTSKNFVMVPAQNGSIQTICLNVYVPPPTCFTGDTRVTLADGTERPIESIREGDFVLGQAGEPTRVVQIDRPLLGRRSLYGLNGGPAFFTAEHPFLTDDGWKSIDPGATATENPDLLVGRLTSRDRLVVLRGCTVPAGTAGSADTLEPELESVPLSRIEGRRAPPETQLYNLLLDGRHAYFANGFLVHNKTTGPSCFIVSAATGSSESQEVLELRHLRDRVSEATALGARLIDAIYREYYEFSPPIATGIEQDPTARQAVLWVVVRPLLAWYKLAGALAFERSTPDAIRQGRKDLLSACPKYLGAGTIARMLNEIRSGADLSATPSRLLRDFAPHIGRAARLRYASWAILDPLARAWNCAASDLDPQEEISQWLGAAPLESLHPGSPEQLEPELARLARFFEFSPTARRQIGRRLAGAWPQANASLEKLGFV